MGLEVLDKYLPQQNVSLDDKLGYAIGWLSGEQYRERLVENIKAHEQKLTPYSGRYNSITELIGQLKNKKIFVCGGGSSIQNTLPRIQTKRRVSHRVRIAAVNKTHDWLISKGIIPDYGILSDPRPHVLDYMTPHPKCMYLLAACLDPKVFKKFKGFNYKLWVPINEELDSGYLIDHLPVEDGWEHAFVAGASTVGLRTVPLFTVCGVTEFELHGFDSCYQPTQCADDIDNLYAYDKPESDYEHLDVTAVSRETNEGFRCITNKNMANQMREFPWFIERSREFTMNNIKDGVAVEQPVEQNITVAGDGVIPWLAWKEGVHVDPTGMFKKYASGHVDYRGPFYNQQESMTHAV
tara:strand:+ start:1958 stop:3013 length:1056 start_codon:yes stop_codon:yes gene_type:complete